MLLMAILMTMMAVAWTGARAIRDIESLEHQVDLETRPVVRRPRLRLVDATGLRPS